MTISPKRLTTKPLADFVSFAAGPERLLILEAKTPLIAEPDELDYLGNAVARAVSRGSFVAMHALWSNLSSGSRLTRELTSQALLLSDAVRNARGQHTNRFRVYHRPPDQQRLFGKSDKKPSGLGWDMVMVSRSRKHDPHALHGMLMQRSTYPDIMASVLRSVPVPETDPAYSHYAKMFRCMASVSTRRFPLATSWKTEDRIAEISTDQLYETLFRV